MMDVFLCFTPSDRHGESRIWEGNITRDADGAYTFHLSDGVRSIDCRPRPTIIDALALPFLADEEPKVAGSLD